MKPLEENRDLLQVIGLENDFFDTTTKVQATKVKIDKQDYLKIKNFCTVKKTQ